VEWDETCASGSTETPSASPSSKGKPLLCFVNGKSGGRRGAALMELLANRDDINAVEIVDLTAEGPTASLRRHVGVVPDLRVLVCGGDGTVAWVLQAMEELGEVRREDVGPNLGPLNRVSHALLLPLRPDADQKTSFHPTPFDGPPPSTSFKTPSFRPSQDPRSAFSR
jgi:hypothetical protein